MADMKKQLSYTASQIDALLGAVPDKVDKVQGKGLSTNDFSDAYKNKVDGTAAEVSVFEKDGLIPIDMSVYTWQNGKYSFTTGDFSSATNRIATTVKMPVRVGTVLRIRVATGYDVNYIGWETGATKPSHYSSSWPTGNEVVVKTKCPLYCFMIRKEDNSDIGTDAASKVEFFYDAPEIGHTFGRYKGKKISIIGDSITTFGGDPTVAAANRVSDGTYTYAGNRCRYPQDGSVSGEVKLLTDVKQTFWMRLIEDFGMTLGVNESWAGSRVSWDGTTEGADVGADKHIASATRIGHLNGNGTPDVILIHGGTNDIGNNVTLGTFNTEDPSGYTTTQIANLPVATFADAYRTLLIRLQKAYPAAEIIALLPNYTNTYYTAEKADKYCEVIKTACDYFGVKWVDMRASGVTVFNLDTYLPDGTHYNVDGMDKAFNNVTNSMLFGSVGGGSNNSDKNVTLTYHSSITASKVTECDYSAVATENIMTINFRIVFNQETAVSTSFPIFVVPSGYRPPAKTVFAAGYANNKIAPMWCNTGGEIRFRFDEAVPSGSTISGTLTYSFSTDTWKNLPTAT